MKPLKALGGYVCMYVPRGMYVRMYVCTYVCMYVCAYVRMYVCTYVRMYVCTFVRLYACTYVRMYVCTYVRMYLWFCDGAGGGGGFTARGVGVERVACDVACCRS